MDISLQPLLEVYPKFPIETEKPPSYVEIYSKYKKDILMVYVQNVQMGSVCSPASATDGLELTGSPLKLDLSLQAALDETLLSDEPQMWTKDEILHAPLDIVKARQIAQLYSQGLRKVAIERATPMWILCNPSAENKPLLLTVQSDNHHFARGIVTYENKVRLNEIDVDVLVKDYIKQEGTTEKWVNAFVNCKYVISGASYGSRSADELLNAPQSGLTELNCEWTSRTLQPPIVNSKVHLEQEVIVGHLASPCNVLWKSVCSLYNMNQLLVDMTAAGFSAVNLEQTLIRFNVKGMKYPNPASRLKELLTMTEMYSYTAKYPKGGFLCITDDTTSLKQCLAYMDTRGSSNDFTYRLWDVLRDCGTAEELMKLFIQALTFISSGKIRPFIDANNKTFLSKLVLKLSRGHSQASKVLKNLSASPPQVLSMVAQVGIEKTMWEYTRIMSLVEHSFFVAGIWNSDAKSNESIDQINQTIQDMTMSGGDFNLNPFESLSSAADQSIRLECESLCEDDTSDLHSVEEFAAFKKKGETVVKKEANEVPLITDEIDISPWKYLLMKFAQVHLCLEHLCRAEVCLKIGFTGLKPIASRLMEYYASEKSPIKTVGQLLTDPSQKITMPIANSIVQDHFKKPAFWYRLEVRRKDDAPDVSIKRDSKIVHVFSQASVFPPLVCQSIEPAMNEAADTTITTDELKYHCTKYVFISNRIPNRLLSLLQH